MQHAELILTLTYSLGAAVFFGYLTLRMGLSPIVGYLLGGIAVGPFTPGVVADAELAEQLAEMGVVLLMFGVGMHFHVKELLGVWKIALPGALGQSAVATLLGTLAGWSFGWGWGGGLIFGLAVSVASTVVLVRVLSDNNDLHTPEGHIAVGWLVVEDLFTVVVLVLLPTLFASQEVTVGSVLIALALTAVKIVGLVTLSYVIGGRAIPWLLEKVAATRSKEMFTLTNLAVALGIAVAAASLFGASMALGAFIAGTIVGRSEFSVRAMADALPMRDAFAVLFFVSVGMLFDPEYLLEAPGVIAATVAIVLLAKSLTALAIVWTLGYPVKIALSVAMVLAQIGEFSFILATLGRSLGVVPTETVQTLVAAAIITITLNPLLYRAVNPLERWLKRQTRLWSLLTSRTRAANERSQADGPDTDEDHAPGAVVIGYGPVGQTLTRLLRDNEIEPTIVELNLETVQRLHGQNIRAVYGDSAHRETLLAAGVERARALVISASGLSSVSEVIRLAREINPKIRVLARCGYIREVAALRRAGATHVISGEGEVALTMVDFILRDLGASWEQIDRERAKVHSDLLGGVTDTIEIRVRSRDIESALASGMKPIVSKPAASQPAASEMPQERGDAKPADEPKN